MDAVRQDFEFATNADFSEEWVFTVDGTTGVNISGMAFYMQLRTAPGADEVLDIDTVFAPGEGFYFVEPNAGRFQVRIDKETLASAFNTLNPSVFVGNEIRLYYDILVLYPSGDQEVWIFGYVTIRKGISNG